MKNTYISVVAVLILIGGGYYLYQRSIPDGAANAPALPGESNQPEVAVTPDPLNSSYEIAGKQYTLTQGSFSQEVAPGSASKETLTVFGTPAQGDLDGDGDLDAALLLTQQTGGSGTFYYAALAMNDGGVTRGTNALLLGDRITPQTIEIRDGRAVANYAVRKTGEPMTAQPSVGKSLWIHLDMKTGTIGELVQDFEGEANPSVMKLDMKQWTWVKTTYNDGKVVTPKKAGAFALTFGADGRFSAKTDCNSAGGKVTTGTGGKIAFSEMMSTLMFCEGSQEGEFTGMLGEAASYHFTSKGELIIELKMDSGTMLFK